MVVSNRILRVAAISLLIGLATIGCGDGGSDQFRVALVSPGPVSDDGWNAAAYEGLLRIERELDASVQQVQVRSPSEFEGVFRDFGRSGYDLVFGHGFEFSETAKEVAVDFPDTVFAITSGVVDGSNLASIQYAIEEPAELAGVLAASVSMSGKIGCVGGVEIPPVKSAFDAFRAGVKRIRPDGEVIVSWVGSWEDVAAARQQSLALLDRGVDVLFHNADTAGLGVFNAAEERGVVAIGCNKDQASVKPQTVIASVVLDIPESLLRIAKDVRAKSFQGEILHYDLKSGIVFLAINEAMRDRLTAEATRALDSLRDELLVR